MGEEEEIQRGSSIKNGLIRTSKKVHKQKKVPQRGLGVAQLEKIRLQELSPPIKPHYIVPSISIPLPNPNALNLNSSSSSSSCRQLFNNVEKHSSAVTDPAGLLVSRLAGESSPIWPLHSFTHRSHFQESPHPNSMMNVSSRGSSSSSLLNLHMELPSNQNNSLTVALWPDEEKVVEIKRAYPIGIENGIGPSKSPSVIHPFEIPEESISFGINGATAAINPNFRLSEEKQKWKKDKKQKGDFKGDFLTLAPPPPTAFTSSDSDLLPQSFDFSSVPYQGIIEGKIVEAAQRGTGLQPFYSFLPPEIMQIGQPAFTDTIPTCNCCADFGENIIDLNLKL